MPDTLVLPPPDDLFVVEGAVMQDIASIEIEVPYRFLIRPNSTIMPITLSTKLPNVAYENAFEAGRFLFLEFRDFLTGDQKDQLIQIDVDPSPAPAHKSQRGDYWHLDGEGMPKSGKLGEVTVSSCLGVKFATGELPLDSLLARQIMNRIISTQLVEEQIELKKLKEVSKPPLTAVAFTRHHLHRGVVNETDVDMPRLFIRAMHF